MFAFNLHQYIIRSVEAVVVHAVSVHFALLLCIQIAAASVVYISVDTLNISIYFNEQLTYALCAMCVPKCVFVCMALFLDRYVITRLDSCVYIRW